MKERIIKSNIGKHELTNAEWLCEYCNEWSNTIEWFIEVNPYTESRQCPKCKSKTVMHK